MWPWRQQIFSIAGIFIALAVGMAIGAGMVQGVVVDQQRHLIGDLEQRFDGLRRRLETERQRQELLAQRLAGYEQILDGLVAERLRNHPGGRPPEDLKVTLSFRRQAGAAAGTAGATASEVPESVRALARWLQRAGVGVTLEPVDPEKWPSRAPRGAVWVVQLGPPRPATLVGMPGGEAGLLTASAPGTGGSVAGIGGAESLRGAWEALKWLEVQAWPAPSP